MRLFIAAPISGEVRDHCTKLEEKLKETGVRMKTVEPENIHITLKFLGEVKSDKVREIINSLESIHSPRLVANTTRIGVFPNTNYIKVVWLGIDSPGLMNLHGKLEMALSKVGFNPEKNFIPHITLARVKEKPNKNLIELIGTEDRVGFTIDKLLLMKSVLTERGPVYEVLHEKQFE